MVHGGEEKMDRLRGRFERSKIGKSAPRTTFNGETGLVRLLSRYVSLPSTSVSKKS